MNLRYDVSVLFRLLLIQLVLFSSPALCQNLNVNWSDLVVSDNKKIGFFNDFIACNNDYVYVKYSRKSGRASKRDWYMVIKVLDKKSMKEAWSKVILNYKNKSDKRLFSGLRYYKTMVFNKVVYMFWKKGTEAGEELYAKVFDEKMEPLGGPKKVFELSKTAAWQLRKPEIFVLANPSVDENLLIGGELVANDGKTTRVDYKLLDTALSELLAGRVELPFSTSGRLSDGYASSYEYGADGKLHIFTDIVPTREERRQLKKNGNLLRGYYDVISSVHLASGELNSYELKLDKKYIKSYKALVEKNSVKITGFFSDLDKDARGHDYHGIFYISLNSDDLKERNSVFNYFSTTQLDELFSKDKMDRKDRTGLFASSKKKQSEEESISSKYIIEQMILAANGDLLLFGDIMYNYSVTNCNTVNGVTNCYTQHFCEKDNVTAFRLSEKGDLIWARNLDRKKTYSGRDRYDLNVVEKNDSYYAIYGSDYALLAEKKNWWNFKPRKQQIDRLEYAVFNGVTGEPVKKEETINRLNIRDEQRKYIDPTQIVTMDNDFYLASERLKLKPSRLALAILAIPVFPVSMAILWSHGSYKANGYLGKISPPEN